MISDVSEKQAKWGQIKEKFGTPRMYYPKDEKARAVVDCAESRLSGRICETCGAPGRLGEDRGWWRTRCPIHEEKDR